MTQKQTFSLLALSAAAVVLAGVFGVRPLFAETAPTATTPDVTDLQQQIQDQQKKIDELQRQQTVYEDTVAKKRQEAASLKNQIDILDNQIATTDLATKKIALELDVLNEQIAQATADIATKNQEIAAQKLRLGELLRFLSRYNNKTTLEISLLNETFSEFYNQLQYLQSVESEAKRSLDTLTSLKTELEATKKTQEEKRQTSEEKHQQLEIEKKSYVSQQDYRVDLLSKTKNSESQFESLLDQAKQEQLGANATIQDLEVQVRQRLQTNGELPAGPTKLIWPIPSRTITAYFHDPTYPFRKYFEHPAVDVATPQGTPIRAAATGYVGVAKNGGLGYSYIMLVHGDGLSTVYGHVSQISVVADDFVVQGQIIGYSGGTPGTQGAGRLTTGPHLHFEVRQKGIPVNPLDFLP